MCPVDYVVAENKVVDEEGVYFARVQSKGAVEFDELIEHIIYRHSSVRKADIIAVLDEYHRSIIHYVLQGLNVSTPTANYATSIQGKLDSPDASVDLNVHKLDASINSGKDMRRAMRDQGETRKVSSRSYVPKLKTYFDSSSGETNAVLTAGSTARIVGENLRFDADDPLQGVFFTQNGTELKADPITKNMPSEVIVDAPAGLTAGEWVVELRNAPDAVGMLSSGRLQLKLTVSNGS